MNDKLFYLIVKIGQLFFFGAIIFLGFVYHYIRVQECTSDPLVFASKHYKDNYGYEFVGSGYFTGLPGNKQSPTLLFNSSEVRVQQPEVNINYANYGIELNILNVSELEKSVVRD